MKSSNGSVTISRNATIQVAPYQNVQVGIAVELPINEGEEVEKAIARVTAIAENEFIAQVLAVKEVGAFWQNP